MLLHKKTHTHNKKKNINDGKNEKIFTILFVIYKIIEKKQNEYLIIKEKKNCIMRFSFNRLRIEETFKQHFVRD